MQLHDWEVDFAAWCSYKYLNSGPGNVSGVFIHQNQSNKKPFRLKGWWGHSEKNRFTYDKHTKFEPMKGAEGWQLSNAPVLGMAAHKASLDIFSEVGMISLVSKSKKLVSALESIFFKAFGYNKCSCFRIFFDKDFGLSLLVIFTFF